MGCNCGRKRQVTGFGSTPARAPEVRAVQGHTPVPHTLTMPDGEVLTFESELAAHMARLSRGGVGEVAPA